MYHNLFAWNPGRHCYQNLAQTGAIHVQPMRMGPLRQPGVERGFARVGDAGAG
jgi:hypothetical protein